MSDFCNFNICEKLNCQYFCICNLEKVSSEVKIIRDDFEGFLMIDNYNNKDENNQAQIEITSKVLVKNIPECKKHYSIMCYCNFYDNINMFVPYECPYKLEQIIII